MEIDEFDGNEDVGGMKRRADERGGGGNCGGWRVRKKFPWAFTLIYSLIMSKICLSSLKNSKLVGS